MRKKFEELQLGDLIPIDLDWREDSCQVTEKREPLKDTIRLVEGNSPGEFFATFKKDGFSKYWKESDTAPWFILSLHYDSKQDAIILDWNEPLGCHGCSHSWKTVGNTIEVLEVA